MIINGFGGNKPQNPNENLGWVTIQSLTATNVAISGGGNYAIITPTTEVAMAIDFRPYKAARIEVSNFSITGTCTNASTSTSKYLALVCTFAQRQTSYEDSKFIWRRQYVASAANVAVSNCPYEEYYYTISVWNTYSHRTTAGVMEYYFSDLSERATLPQSNNTSLAYDFHVSVRPSSSNPMALTNCTISGTWNLQGLLW